MAKLLVTMTLRDRSTSLAASLLGLALTSAALGGCCTTADSTRCFDWEQSTTCPDTAVARTALEVDAVKSPGTLWPAHGYLIHGVLTTVPAACCYEVTTTMCTEDLR